MTHPLSLRPLQLAVCALALGCSAAYAGKEVYATAAAKPITTDQIALKFRPGVVADLEAAALKAAAARFGVQITGNHSTGLSEVLHLDRRIPNAVAAKLAAALKAADKRIASAEADAYMTADFVPNDPLYSGQWHYFESAGGIKMQGAWDKSIGTGVVVAVLDTGYRPHADLVANIIPGYDFISNVAMANDGNGRDPDALDPGDWSNGTSCSSRPSSWHGTHVAGTIAAVTNNSVGVAGVAYGAKVQPVRVLGVCGGTFSDLEAAIVWASGGTVPGVPANPTPARVINMSLSGFTACSPSLQAAVDGAVSRGTVVVVAAGNAFGNAANYAPANCNNVITVAATGRNGGKASYSNTGAVVEIAAPGGDGSDGVLSTLNTGATVPGADSYVEYNGTSMATPHVAGTVALMLSTKPSWTPAKVLARLQAKARAFPAACVGCGAGIVNAKASIKP